MNILIIGFGVVGKYYFKYLKKNKNVKNIFIYNNFKLPKNSKYKQIDFDLIEIKKKILNMQLFAPLLIFITSFLKN